MLYYESSMTLKIIFRDCIYQYCRDFMFFYVMCYLFHKRAPQGGLTKKEIQLNFCNMFYILMFNEFYLFAKRLLIA